MRDIDALLFILGLVGPLLIPLWMVLVYVNYSLLQKVRLERVKLTTVSTFRRSSKKLFIVGPGDKK